MVVTYVFEGREYVLTGRSAKRKTLTKKERILVEIKPASISDESTDYNKWVSEEELFEVKGIIR